MIQYNCDRYDYIITLSLVGVPAPTGDFFIYGLQRPHGSYPHDMTSSRVADTSCLFSGEISPTLEHPGEWNFIELLFKT